MKKATKATPDEVEAAPAKNTRIIRVVTPYTDEMIAALEDRLDAIISDGFEVVACVPYGVEHMVILLKRAAA